MNRIELACYSLIASAFILSALLIYNLQTRMDAQANAGVVLNRDNVTLLTARVRGGTNKPDEALFVLSNLQQRIVVYRVDEKGFGPVGTIDLSNMFVDNGGMKVNVGR